MRTIQSTLQTSIFLYECHANTSPVEVSAKVFDTCNKYMPTVREIRQITEPMKYEKYPTVLIYDQDEPCAQYSTDYCVEGS